MAVSKTIWDKIGSARRLWIYGGTLALVLMMFYSGIPPMVSEKATQNIRDTYNFIDSLGPNDTIVMWGDNPSAYYLGHIPGAVAMFNQMIKKGVKLLYYAIEPDGPLMFKLFVAPQCQATMDEYGYTYGKDYANLGYVAGGESGIAAVFANLKFKETDIYGTPVSDLPVMNNKNTIKDCTAIVVLTGWSQGYYMRQGKAKYGTPVIVIGFEAALATWPPYVEAGQMFSFVHGWTGGAMYEKLIGIPGLATKGLNALSIMYIVIIFWIVLGNISYWGKRMSGGK